MGGTYWSDDHYRDRLVARKASGTPDFDYSAKTASKPRSAHVAHRSLDPKGVKIRESRDSTEHPESHAVAVLFDVTGSMSTVPQILQKNLPKLMGLLIRKSYLKDPQILCGAIGDATCDRVPLQVGQFESGIEIENDLTNIFLESGGGGHITESYELAMYFMARHTALDCFEKRNRRGYLFIIGDETPYPVINPGEVEDVIGDTLQAPIPTEEIVEELQKLYDVYYILPKMTAHYDTPTVFERWKQLLGQNVIRLEQPAGICELIASTIGVCEGTELDKVTDDLKDVGTDIALANSVRGSLATVASGRARKGSEISVPDSGAGSGVATV